MIMVTLLCFIGCEIEVHPIGYAAKRKAAIRRHLARHYKPRHAPVVTQRRPQEHVEVTPEWMSHYKALEEVHGNYTIPEDAHTEVLADGKVRVPHGVVKHYNDLIRAPIPERPPPLIDITPSP